MFYLRVDPVDRIGVAGPSSSGHHYRVVNPQLNTVSAGVTLNQGDPNSAQQQLEYNRSMSLNVTGLPDPHAPLRGNQPILANSGAAVRESVPDASFQPSVSGRSDQSVTNSLQQPQPVRRDQHPPPPVAQQQQQPVTQHTYSNSLESVAGTSGMHHTYLTKSQYSATSVKTSAPNYVILKSSPGLENEKKCCVVQGIKPIFG